LVEAFSDLSNAKDYLDFERKLKDYERLSDEFDRITRASYIPSEDDPTSEHDDKGSDSDLSGAWTIRTTTYIVPESYLKLRKIVKDIEEEIAREDRELGLDL
jgi:hypothetical protein